MEAFWIFLITVAVFGVLIFVHELGHFIACRIFGVGVKEFAIGMGPKLFSRKSKKSGTVYSVRALPIGGFNNIEDGTVELENGETFTPSTKEELPPDAFGVKPVWQRMIIIVSGAFMNLLLGFIIMIFVVIGTEKYGSTTIAYFTDTNGTAQIEQYAGLMAGDKVIKVGSRRVHTGDELVYTIFAKGEKTVDVVVERDGKRITVPDVAFPTMEKDGVTFGIINFKIFAEEKNFVNTVKQSFYGSINAIVQVFDSLFGMVTGKYGLKHISGPIGVGEVIGQAAKIGLIPLLNIAVVLTMNLGIFNLIPIPGLDGGKLIFLIIEAIVRKPIPRKLEETVTTVCITALMLLVAVVAFKDVFVLIFR